MARAIELWEAQSAADDEREEASFAKEALAELNVPPEYFDKARRQLDEEAQRARASVKSRRFKVRFGIVAALTSLLLLQVFSPYAFTSWKASFTQNAWQLRSNPSTQASLQPNGEFVRVQVERFSVPQDGRYFSNLRASDPPRTLWGRDQMIIQVRGGGELHAARVYLRSGSSERWRSPDIPLTSSWVEHRISVEAFERQIGGRARWEPDRWETPTRISMLQIKVGYTINDVNATGTLDVGELRFE